MLTDGNAKYFPVLLALKTKARRLQIVCFEDGLNEKKKKMTHL